MAVRPCLKPQRKGHTLRQLRFWCPHHGQLKLQPHQKSAMRYRVSFTTPLKSKLQCFTNQDGHIQVGTTSPLFGDGPNTVQTGGCGMQGEVINVASNYFVNIDGSSADSFGPPG